MEVPISREIPLDNALLLLTKQNQIAEQEHSQMTFTYALYTEDQEIYQSTVELPQADFSLFLTIIAEINEQPFEDEQQKEELLQWFYTVFGEKIKKKKEAKEKKVKQPKEKKPMKISTGAKKVALFVVVITGLIAFGAGTFYYATSRKEIVPTLEDYLQREEYTMAAEKYPNEITTIENELFMLVRTKDKSFLKALKEYNKQFPTIQGEFDLAMFDYDYTTAAKIYGKNIDLLKKDSDRSTLAGYSYLKIDDLKSAKEILSETNNAELEKFVLLYEQLTKIIQEKNKEIKELQKKPSENKETIEKAINELYDAKEKLNQF
ncbi:MULTISPECIES: hypothetical protein [unclassified Enterococcus]|uniref:hypothetical protein n=1 Tax=unclassified Enterococcus TaxID=2608891 RepID=UPI0011233C5F|nr:MULTISPECIES: hypothetical protein [unclassified Enterococcus]